MIFFGGSCGSENVKKLNMPEYWGGGAPPGPPSIRLWQRYMIIVISCFNYIEAMNKVHCIVISMYTPCKCRERPERM